MKLCIDPGHGTSNRKNGVYDSGAVGGLYEEAGLALVWAHALRKACEDRGLTVFMTRTLRSDAAPVSTRARRAVAAGCTHLISLHFNEYENPTSNGFETLYRTGLSKSFASSVHSQMKSLLGLKDRGLKLRRDLAVLGDERLDSCLLELGFISNRADMAILTTEALMQKACRHLAAHLAAWAQAHR